MRIFISAGEPSGDLHAANLIEALRARCPSAEFVGFGGPRCAAAGATLLFPLADLAVMGITQVLLRIGTFLKLLRQADRMFREQPPDVVVLVDYPGFNFWMARKARARGIKVVFYIPPQLWAWAGHRVERMKRNVDLVLCGLAFEPDWYRSRGFEHAEFVGHPFFDETAERILDGDFLLGQSARGGPIVAILPGSREGEIHRNGLTLLKAASALSARRPDTRFLITCFKPTHAERMTDLMRDNHIHIANFEIHSQRTPEIIRIADLAWAVSGSVSLELMAEALPTCIVYKVNPLYRRIARWVLQVPYITLVNLLAGREVLPEFLTSGDVSADLAAWAEYRLSQPEERARDSAELAALRDRVAMPGASRRAADRILALLGSERGAPLPGPHARAAIKEPRTET